MQTKKLQINSDFVCGHKKGDIVNVSVDYKDIPMNSFWRQRLKDAQRDNCCEWVKEKVKETKKPKKEVKEDVI